MCMILSPNFCTVTIVEYSSTDVTLLRSCLSVLSEHVASQSKWQSADLDFLKLAKKRKSVCSALFRGGGVEQGGGGKSPFSLLSEPFSPSSLLFEPISPSSLNVSFSFSPSSLLFPPISPSSQLYLGHFSILPILFLPPLRGNVFIWSDKISNVSAILGRKSTARLKVNENTRSSPLSESLKFRKRMGFSVLGSLITVPLHSTLAVNNLGLKFVS